MKTYPIAEQLNRKECEALGLAYPFKGGGQWFIRVFRTGEFRNPKAGEWYLSGAIPEGWRACNDYNQPFWICKIGLFQREITMKHYA